MWKFLAFVVCVSLGVYLIERRIPLAGWGLICVGLYIL